MRPRLPTPRNPAQLVLGAFATLIVVGAVALTLPWSTDTGGGLGAVDALFTSTSATTVTGLATVDVAGLSLFGELVLLALIQIGGFGIMTVGSVVALVASRRVGLRQRLVARAEIGAIDIGELRSLIRAIAKITVVVEAATFVALFVRFSTSSAVDDTADAAYQAAFHAVSAFNNAGISLRSNSLVDFVGDPIVVGAISVAFIIGGLGFPVLVQLRRRGFDPRRWNLHARITVAATLALIVVGPLVVTLFEWRNPDTLGSLPLGDKLLAGWFQGVTPRTAGFNTVDIGAMEEPTWVAITTLMFVGAGPASTSGGIKVTTFAVLAFALWAEVRGETDINAYRRRLPAPLIRQATTIALLSVGVVVGASLVLMSIEDLPLAPALFEVTSAFGTVGLSTGITPALQPWSHVLLVVIMLIGRVGPLTFVTALALRQTTRAYHFPEERPIIG